MEETAGVLAIPAALSWPAASVAGNRAQEVSQSILAARGCGHRVREGPWQSIRIPPFRGLASRGRRPRSLAQGRPTCLWLFLSSHLKSTLFLECLK